jgi:prepilin-type N-terminal cleavage/methylation domain-containing protein
MLLSPRERRARQRGFSLIELLIVIAIILIILSIALPQMGKSRRHAQEMAAVATIRTINSMEQQYYTEFGHYATTLSQLGPPSASNGQEGADAAGLIPANLASGSTGGYNYTISQTASGYAVSAVPKSFGSTGSVTYYSDESGVIRQNRGQDPATANSPPIGSS